MKPIEELKLLRDQMVEAYNGILNSDTVYDTATVAYAKKCAEDAEDAYRRAQDEKTTLP